MRLTAVAAVLALGLNPANATDVYNGSTKDPASSFAAPTVSWTGLYLGANLGWGWAGNRDNVLADFTGTGNTKPDYSVPAPGLSAPVDGGVTGGLHVGYNRQFGSFVVGVETDFQGAALDTSADTALSIPKTLFTPNLSADLPLTASVEQNIDYWGTIRGRAGFAFDHFFVYGTGGFAYGDVKDSITGTFTNTSGTYSSSVKHEGIRTGYAAGGGAEYKVGNWSLGVEYLYIDLGSESINAAAVNPVSGAAIGAVATSKINSDFDVVRARLTYHLTGNAPLN